MGHYRILYACGVHVKAQCRCADLIGNTKLETIEQHRCPADGCPDSLGELRKAQAPAEEKLTMSDYAKAQE